MTRIYILERPLVQRVVGRQIGVGRLDALGCDFREGRARGYL